MRGKGCRNKNLQVLEIGRGSQSKCSFISPHQIDRLSTGSTCLIAPQGLLHHLHAPCSCNLGKPSWIPYIRNGCFKIPRGFSKGTYFQWKNCCQNRKEYWSKWETKARQSTVCWLCRYAETEAGELCPPFHSSTHLSFSSLLQNVLEFSLQIRLYHGRTGKFTLKMF